MPIGYKYKIIIADPSIILSNGLEALLNSNPEYEVIALFTSINDLSNHIINLKPDIIIFNPILVSSYKSFRIKKLLKRNEDDVVIALLYNYTTSNILSGFDEWIDIFEKPEKIILKIKSAIEKTILLKQERKLNAKMNLSDREKEIMISVAQGLKNREIAERYNISIHTVIAHRRNITKKTKIRTLSGQIIYTIRNLLS